MIESTVTYYFHLSFLNIILLCPLRSVRRQRPCGLQMDKVWWKRRRRRRTRRAAPRLSGVVGAKGPKGEAGWRGPEMSCENQKKPEWLNLPKGQISLPLTLSMDSYTFPVVFSHLIFYPKQFACVRVYCTYNDEGEWMKQSPPFSSVSVCSSLCAKRRKEQIYVTPGRCESYMPNTHNWWTERGREKVEKWEAV